MVDVSVVIVNWNTRDILRDCLASIFAETRGLSFEVIVVDNGSTDGSVEMVRKEFSQVTLIANNENRGFAAANNQGIQTSRGRYVLLLNSDTVVLDRAIEKAVTFVRQHPEAAVVTCRTLGSDGSRHSNCYSFPSLRGLFLAATGIQWMEGVLGIGGRPVEDQGAEYPRQVDWVAGCFMLVRREAIDQVGLMDEGYFMYAEDTDWCYRFTEAGWKVLFVPGAEIVHHLGQSATRAERDMRLERRVSVLRYFRKHHGAGVASAANFLLSVHDALRIVGWSGAWAWYRLAGSDGKGWATKIRSALKTLQFHRSQVSVDGS